MQFKIPFEKNAEGAYFYEPGFLSNSRPSNGRYNKETIIKSFINDCKCLDLLCEESNLESFTNLNAFKVGIFLWLKGSKFEDYHFVCRNLNLRWSEKDGWGGLVSSFSKPLDTRKYKLIKIMEISKR